jgi:hypothetical protein
VDEATRPTSAATAPSLGGDADVFETSTPDAPAYTPTTKDFKIALKVKSKDCFGSAGCNVVYELELTIVNRTRTGVNGPTTETRR